MSKYELDLSPEAKGKLIGEFSDKVTSRTPEDQTILAEVLLRELCSETPVVSCEAISSLCGGLVSGEQVFKLVIAPSRARLSGEQESLVMAGTLLYGLYCAVTELALGEDVKAEKVFEWLGELVAKHHEEKGPFDSLAPYRVRTKAILAELAKI